VPAGVVRAGVFLVGALTVFFLWERNQAADDVSRSGRVVHVNHDTDDDRGFRIRYRHEGGPHTFTTGIGIIDHYTGYADLRVGDSVPVAVDPDEPSNARLDTFSGSYPLTVSLGAFCAVFVVTIGWMSATGRVG